MGTCGTTGGTGDEDAELARAIAAVRRAVALTDAYVATGGHRHTPRHGGLSGYRQAEGEAIRDLLARLPGSPGAGPTADTPEHRDAHAAPGGHRGTRGEPERAKIPVPDPRARG